jgi:hypothetical protein
VLYAGQLVLVLTVALGQLRVGVLDCAGEEVVVVEDFPELARDGLL